MNEKIKELVDITAELMPGVYNLEYESGKKGIEFTEQALEKFAELIVLKCMDLVKDCYAEPGQSLYQSVCASTIIEEHFGIEE